jgi:hypothetical protein
MADQAVAVPTHEEAVAALGNELEHSEDMAHIADGVAFDTAWRDGRWVIGRSMVDLGSAEEADHTAAGRVNDAAREAVEGIQDTPGRAAGAEAGRGRENLFLARVKHFHAFDEDTRWAVAYVVSLYIVAGPAQVDPGVRAGSAED